MGVSGPSLLIESTDSMIDAACITVLHVRANINSEAPMLTTLLLFFSGDNTDGGGGGGGGLVWPGNGGVC